MFNYLFPFKRKNKDSASVAKKRLQQVILESYDKSNNHPNLSRELLAVIAKYYKDIDPDQVTVDLAREENYSILKLNITLPD